MNKDIMKQRDIKIFSDIANYLVFLTTKDEYGSTRSKGIETYKEYADELNNINLVPKSGRWTESSIKQFYTRVRKRYEDCDLRDYIDLGFAGRSSWEYQSRTTEEEVREDRNTRKKVPEEYVNGIFYSYDKCGRNYNELELWGKLGIEDPDSEYWRVMKKYENNFEI
jgi:hypothetical protein